MYARKVVVHPVYMAKRKDPRLRKKAQYRRSFIRQWREFRELTLEEVASRVETITDGAITTTHASLSRIERGVQPYGQPLLEAIAVALRTDTASLLMRDPSDPDGIWSVWDNAKPGERKMIVDIARTIVKTGT